MFNRAAYKKSALESLKNNWGSICLVAIVFLVLSGLSEVASPIVSVCVSGILSVSMIFTIMKMISVSQNSDSESKISFSTFLQGIEDHWLNALLGGLWNSLWIFLWSLLFVIPGIVKYYSYSMMFYILAENPKISAIKAMDLSKILTDGHKADLFIMDLSFLGWGILSALVAGLGLIWLIPYMTTAKTHAYYDLKRMAISQNKLTLADFEA